MSTERKQDDDQTPPETGAADAPVIEVTGPRIVGQGPAWMDNHTRPQRSEQRPPVGRPAAWFDGARHERTSAPSAPRSPTPPRSPAPTSAASPLAGTATSTNLASIAREVTDPIPPAPDYNPFVVAVPPAAKGLTLAQSANASEIVRTLRGLPDIRSQLVSYWAAYPATFLASALAESSLNPKAIKNEANGKTAVGVFQILATNFAGLYQKRSRLGSLSGRLAAPDPIPAFPTDILYAVLHATGLTDFIQRELSITWAPGAVATGVGVPVGVVVKKPDGIGADFLAATLGLAKDSGIPLDLVWLRCWWKASSPAGALSVARSAGSVLVASRARNALATVIASGFPALRAARG